MNSLTPTARKTILLAGVLVLGCAAIALSIGNRTHSQRPNIPGRTTKDSIMASVERSPNLPLRVAGNEDCPFRIMAASVKQVSGSDFSQLTGRTTDLPVVTSVPEITLANTSGQAIISFVLVIRDPPSRSTRGFVQEKVSIAPGTIYSVKREHFFKFERQAIADSNQPARQIVVQPRADSEDYWLQFPAGSTDVFVTVGKVTFQDGSSWMIKEGGEVK
ncbi:MAG TPA: hypothetical protein VIT88_10650 [Pyrinomonadaceae bacterium]